uniref:Protein SEC13 homolog n=1 Tax=Haptolina ericina TaxID=156174 RepID=A0A7S3B8H0_9EUKA
MIKVYDVVEGGERKHVADLSGHDGPVWQVAWAHPQYGNILASCSYDRQVMVWKEHSPQNWSQVYIYRDHEGSVNSITWAPKEFGLCLACASSDESVRVLKRNDDDTWDVKLISKAHVTGCNAVSWSPAIAPDAIASGGESTPVMRLVTGGCDNFVKLWRYSEETASWERDVELPQLHTDWVRDVAFAPSLGAGALMFASCSQDKKVIIWTQTPEGSWTHKVITFSCVLWRVSWSVTGNILAVSGGDNQVTLWKDNLLGDWEQIGQLTEDGATTKG